VLAGNLVAAIRDLVEAARAKAVQVAALAPYERHQRALPAADERHERREMEVSADPHAVGHRLDERARPPHVVEPRGEHREPVGAVAVEIVLEEGANPREVVLQADPLVVRETAAIRLRPPLALVEQRAEARVCVTGRRRDARVEVHVEADRTPLLRLELGKLPKPVPGHRFGHQPPFPLDQRLYARG
jgi:hypothetical protein